MADVLRRGYRVLLPFGEDWPFDLMVLRNGIDERVQCKYGRSDGRVLIATCESTDNWSIIKHTKALIDVLASTTRPRGGAPTSRPRSWGTAATW